MSPKFEKSMRNNNTTEETRVICSAHNDFKTVLEKRLRMPIYTMKDCL